MSDHTKASSPPLRSEKPAYLPHDFECCADWKPQTEKINGPIVFQQMRGGYRLGPDYFKHWEVCPWCGKSRRVGADSEGSRTGEPSADTRDAERWRWIRRRLRLTHEQSLAGNVKEGLDFEIGATFLSTPNYDRAHTPTTFNAEKVANIEAAIDAAMGAGEKDQHTLCKQCGHERKAHGAKLATACGEFQ